MDDTLRKQTQIKISESLTIDAPYFDIGGHIVWGATAMILSELSEIIRPHFRLQSAAV